VKSDSAAHIASIRLNFADLVNSYQTSRSAFASGAPTGHTGVAASGQDTSTSEAKNSVGDWRSEFSEIERDLTYLIGGGPAQAAESGGANQSVATAGSSVPPAIDVQASGVKNLSATLRDTLEEFRRQLELFYVEAPGEAGSITMSPPSGGSGSSTSPGGHSTTGAPADPSPDSPGTGAASSGSGPASRAVGSSGSASEEAGASGGVRAIRARQ
jgi:hypothetical protein